MYSVSAAFLPCSALVVVVALAAPLTLTAATAGNVCGWDGRWDNGRLIVCCAALSWEGE